jgi:hypothetical protein
MYLPREILEVILKIKTRDAIKDHLVRTLSFPKLVRPPQFHTTSFRTDHHHWTIEIHNNHRYPRFLHQWYLNTEMVIRMVWKDGVAHETHLLWVPYEEEPVRRVSHTLISLK